MFALLYCLHAPHFPAASMRQFYRRAETERAKRGDGGDGRRGEGLMKMELNAYAVTEFKWRLGLGWRTGEGRTRVAKVKRVAWRRRTKTKAAKKNRPNRERKRVLAGGNLNTGVWEKGTEERKSERKRTQVTERDAGGGKGGGTTNQVGCLITSCIPHSSPILLNLPPAPSPVARSQCISMATRQGA